MTSSPGSRKSSSSPPAPGPASPMCRAPDCPHVITSADALTGRVPPGDRVVVVSEDDRAGPLAVADHLAGAGHQVTLVYQSPAPSPQVGKYSIGSVLARLDAEGGPADADDARRGHPARRRRAG